MHNLTKEGWRKVVELKARDEIAVPKEINGRVSYGRDGLCKIKSSRIKEKLMLQLWQSLVFSFPGINNYTERPVYADLAVSAPVSLRGASTFASLSVNSASDEAIFSEEYEFSNAKVIWRLSPFIKDDNSKIHYNDNAGNNKKSSIVHIGLPLANHYPYEDNESYYSGSNIKVQKRHNFFGSFFANLTAMLKNNTVMAMPVENVTNGTLTATPGINTPTTNEVNIIFAPSKKKSDITSNLSLSNIQTKSTTQSAFCQDAKWTKVIDLKPGDLIGTTAPAAKLNVTDNVWDVVAYSKGY